jgi:hypothetical protein
VGNVHKLRISRVFLRDERIGDAPPDVHIRVVPYDAVLVMGIVKITTLVQELHRIRKCEKSVREPGGNIDLIVFSRGEEHAGPFSIGGRARTDIDGNIKGFTFDDTTKLCLRMLELVMQSAERVLHGAGVVVLNERSGDAQLGKFSLVVRLDKETPCVLVSVGAYFADTGKRCLKPLQGSPILGKPQSESTNDSNSNRC